MQYYHHKMLKCIKRDSYLEGIAKFEQHYIDATVIRMWVKQALQRGWIKGNSGDVELIPIKRGRVEHNIAAVPNPVAYTGGM